MKETTRTQAFRVKHKMDKLLEKITGPACIVLIGKYPGWMNSWYPCRPHYTFPETGLDINQQAAYMTMLLKERKNLNQNFFIITRSPIIVSDFDRMKVLIVKGSKIESPLIQTFGAGLTEILTEIFDRKDHVGDLAKTFIDDLFKRAIAGEPVQPLKEEARALGMSVEKALLFNALIYQEKKDASNNDSNKSA